MNKAKLLSCFIIVVFSFILSACNNTVVPEQPGPYYDTVQVATQAGDFFRDLCNNDQWPEQSDSFIAYAQGLEEVVSVAMNDDETCVIQYKSGVHHFFNCNIKDEDTDDEDDGTEANLLAKKDSIVVSYGFPEVTGRTYPPASAAVYPLSGRGGQRTRNSCQQILDAFDYANYSVPGAPQDPTVEWFKQWDDNRTAIVYLNGHGGRYTPRTPDNSTLLGQSFNYLYTTTEIDSAAYMTSPYAEDISATRLQFGSGEYANTLVVTPLFFDHYLTGDLPNSIIYLDVCYSLDTSVQVSIADSLLNRGTEIFFGWDNRVYLESAGETAAFFFDRLCGYSQVEADDLDPPSRPFTALQVYEHLEEEGRTRQPFARLGYVRQMTEGDNDTAAIPIISGGYYQWAAEAVAHITNPSIVLTGYFGSNPGEVLFNNQPLPASDILLWESDRIVAYLADDNSAGDLRVRVNGNLKSNPMRLTSFSGSANWTIDRAGQYSGTISAEFEGRVLLQLMRSEIDEEASTAQGVFANSLYAAERGQVSWNISGDWTDDFGDYHEVEAQGSGPVVPEAVSTVNAGLGCLIEFNLDPDPANATYELLMVVGVTGTETITTPEGTVTQQPWVSGYGNTDMTPNPLPPNWVIPAGSASCEDCTQFEWSEIRPDTEPIPPTDDDAYHGRIY